MRRSYILLLAYHRRLLRFVASPRFFKRVLVSASASVAGLFFHNLSGAYASISLPIEFSMASINQSTSEMLTAPCEQDYYHTFLTFAAVEYGGKAYMTPHDFIRCVIGIPISTSYKHRRQIDKATFTDIISKTPALSKNSSNFFRNLGANGLISFNEYMFLLSILTHPQTGFQVAFRMFDRDCNEAVDLQEFIKITKIYSRESDIQTKLQECEGKPHTTLTRHFFGKEGRSKLCYQDFSQFVKNFQREILQLEFNQYAIHSQYISPHEFGLSILRYQRLDQYTVAEYMQRLAKVSELSNNPISFEAYKAFFDFLYVLDDIRSALQMFILARRSVSKAEFQRAAHAVTGAMLEPAVVDTIFALFDANGDGHLSAKEFLETMGSRTSRGRVSSSGGMSVLDSYRRCVGKQLSEYQ